MRESEGNILHPYYVRSLPTTIVASAGQPLRLVHPPQNRPKFYPFINRYPTVHCGTALWLKELVNCGYEISRQQWPSAECNFRHIDIISSKWKQWVLSSSKIK